MNREITDIDAATVHKFQGKEKDNIIISTVDDEISDFADDPYLINVAVSRAKKKLMLVVTGNEQSKEHNITDLIDYIQYNNFEVVESKIYSIFDYLYKQYTEERIAYLQKYKKISEYDSENLMYSLIQEIIADNKYSSLDVVCHFPLKLMQLHLVVLLLICLFQFHSVSFVRRSLRWQDLTRLRQADLLELWQYLWQAS